MLRPLCKAGRSVAGIRHQAESTLRSCSQILHVSTALVSLQGLKVLGRAREKTPTGAMQHKDGPAVRPAPCSARLCKPYAKSRVPGARLLSQPSIYSFFLRFNYCSHPGTSQSTGSLTASVHSWHSEPQPQPNTHCCFAGT